jgi:hypothetical protein
MKHQPGDEIAEEPGDENHGKFHMQGYEHGKASAQH